MSEAPMDKLPLPCPKCLAEPSLLLYRGFSRAILMCETCEHIWQADVDSHAALKSIKPSVKT